MECLNYRNGMEILILDVRTKHAFTARDTSTTVKVPLGSALLQQSKNDYAVEDQQ
jgi:hypothetical protein